MSTMTRLAASLEYLEAVFTILLPAGTLIDAQPVRIALRRLNVTTWYAATWQGDPAATRTARTTVPLDDLVPGTYRVLIEVTDSPEVIVAVAYELDLR